MLPEPRQSEINHDEENNLGAPLVNHEDEQSENNSEQELQVPQNIGRPNFSIFFSTMFSEDGPQPLANELHKHTMMRLVIEFIGGVALAIAQVSTK